MFFAVGILFLNTGVGGGAAEIGTSATPFFDGFKAVFGEGAGASLLGLLALIGLIASFFTIIYAYGRNTYSLSRAGYFPQSLSITHPTRNTPYVALIVGAVIGYALSLVIYFAGQSESALAGKIVGALLYMAVFGAVISYFMQCLAFIVLRRKLPNIERPYRSPVGVWGAAIAGAIALVALISLFFNEDYRPGVYGTARLLRDRHHLLRDQGTAQAGAVARRGVRDVARTARREPSGRGLRDGLRHRDFGGRFADSVTMR